jgi:hypothetical protein
MSEMGTSRPSKTYLCSAALAAMGRGSGWSSCSATGLSSEKRLPLTARFSRASIPLSCVLIYLSALQQQRKRDIATAKAEKLCSSRRWRFAYG